MKTMSCRDMGGPCDAIITGNTPEEMMAAGEKHIRMCTDMAHMKVVEQMRSFSPEETKKWNDAFMEKWKLAS